MASKILLKILKLKISVQWCSFYGELSSAIAREFTTGLVIGLVHDWFLYIGNSTN